MGGGGSADRRQAWLLVATGSLFSFALLCLFGGLRIFLSLENYGDGAAAYDLNIMQVKDRLPVIATIHAIEPHWRDGGALRCVLSQRRGLIFRVRRVAIFAEHVSCAPWAHSTFVLKHFSAS